MICRLKIINTKPVPVSQAEKPPISIRFRINIGWITPTLLWKNTSGSKKNKLISMVRSVETEFPVIVFNDKLTSEEALSCKPTDFKNEFPATVYNDALKFKSDPSTEPVEIPHRIDEFDLKTETSLSKCNEDEQNVVYFIDLFPFNIIYPDDLKSNKDNDNNEIQSSGVMMLMENIDAQGQSLFTSRAWRRLFEIRGPLVHELILKFFSTFRFGEALVDLDTVEEMKTYRDPMLRLCHRLIACSIAERSQAPEKVTVTDLFYLRGTDVGLVSVPYLLARMLTEERLQGLIVIVRDLLVIDMAELDAPEVDEGALDDLEPMQAPQQPHAIPMTFP
nr:hypothetical protein [Tanacetum cinerariifolium]